MLLAWSGGHINHATAQMLFFPFPGVIWFWSFYLFIRLNLALNLNPCCLRLLYESENIHPFCPLILLPWEGHIFIPWNLWHGHMTCFCIYNESGNVSVGVCSQGCRDLSVSRHHAAGGRSAVQHADSMYLLFPVQTWHSYAFSIEQAQPDPAEPTHGVWAQCHCDIWCLTICLCPALSYP